MEIPIADFGGYAIDPPIVVGAEPWARPARPALRRAEPETSQATIVGDTAAAFGPSTDAAGASARRRRRARSRPAPCRCSPRAPVVSPRSSPDEPAAGDRHRHQLRALDRRRGSGGRGPSRHRRREGDDATRPGTRRDRDARPRGDRPHHRRAQGDARHRLQPRRHRRACHRHRGGAPREQRRRVRRAHARARRASTSRSSRPRKRAGSSG